MKIFKWVKRIIIGLFLLSIVLTFTYKWIPVPFTELMLKRYFINGSKIEKKWIPINSISNSIQLAVVSSEDQNFIKHHGFDFKQIQKVLEDQQEGGRVRGASTISQQTAKNVFLWDGKNYIRKGLEAYFTCLIEWVWGKKRIMEVYLNVIEFGDGIYGIESASQHYFGKSASNLTKAESATLAALLPNPRKYGKNINGRYIQKRKIWILKQMRNLGGTLIYP
ncbi:monofunctional biosynthetic peptidoglycan transglycosylase [Apibacter adventoris]|uniref:monofunctional biosynthetic peptidoglycan transglycosylase n=1 Tax=Apibacter adventoris TaxID=1679466 RepID=UPI000CF62EF0|nr:monofunctional biosynthetic peptidoglycan transglycosylase [Apibacter adventoris]PQL94346.1 monofunctional biosynthetic peptidoglycan transglycosylase [Apibacter adventoris]